MAHLPGFLLICLAAGAVAAESVPDYGRGRVGLLFGVKSLSEDAIDERFGDFTSVGISLDGTAVRGPVSIGFDLIYSTADMSNDSHSLYSGVNREEIDLSIIEWDVGATAYLGRYVGLPWLDPHIGGGLSISVMWRDTKWTNLDSGSSHESSKGAGPGLGVWVGGGMDVIIGDHFVLGGQVRYNTGDVSFDEVDVEAGGISYMGMIGYCW